MSEVEE